MSSHKAHIIECVDWRLFPSIGHCSRENWHSDRQEIGKGCRREDDQDVQRDNYRCRFLTSLLKVKKQGKLFEEVKFSKMLKIFFNHDMINLQDLIHFYLIPSCT